NPLKSLEETILLALLLHLYWDGRTPFNAKFLRSFKVLFLKSRAVYKPDKEPRMSSSRKKIALSIGNEVSPVENYKSEPGHEIYGSLVFNDAAQKQYLSKDVYRKLRATTCGENLWTVPSPTRSRKA